MVGWLRSLFGGPRLPPQFPDHEFFSSVHGVSHRNQDRKSRQKIIKEDVYRGMILELKLEDGNKFDKNAIALLTTDRKQIGYLDSHIAHDVRNWVKRRKHGESHSD